MRISCRFNSNANALLSVLVIAAMSTAGCKLLLPENGRSGEPDSNVLRDTAWELAKIEILDGEVLPGSENNIWQVPDDEFYTLKFVDEVAVTGQSFCNSCAGNYWITSPDSIRIVWGCSRAACGISAGYNSSLNKSRRYELNGDSLRLHFDLGRSEGVLYFKRTNNSF